MRTSFLNSTPGRACAAIVGFNFLSMGADTMIGSPSAHALIFALAPMLTIAAMILTVGLMTVERPPLDAAYVLVLAWIPGALFMNILNISHTLSASFGVLFLLLATAFFAHAIFSNRVYGQMEAPAQTAAA